MVVGIAKALAMVTIMCSQSRRYHLMHQMLEEGNVTETLSKDDQL